MFFGTLRSKPHHWNGSSMHGARVTVLECFNRSSGRPVVIPRLSAKALLHLAVQRKCIGDESDKAMFKSICSRHPVMGSKHYEGDSDLEATLGIIDCVFGDSEPMHWQNSSFTVPHHAWMGHILLYRAWDVLRKGEPLPDDIKEFVLHSLRLEPPPRLSPTACSSSVWSSESSCTLMTHWSLTRGEMNLCLTSRTRLNRFFLCSHESSLQITRIYKKLTETFSNPTPTTEEID